MGQLNVTEMPDGRKGKERKGVGWEEGKEKHRAAGCRDTSWLWRDGKVDSRAM